MLKDIVLIVGTHVHSIDGPNEQAALPWQRYTRHPVTVLPVSINSQSVSVSMMNSCKYAVEDIRCPNLKQDQRCVCHQDSLPRTKTHWMTVFSKITLGGVLEFVGIIPNS